MSKEPYTRSNCNVPLNHTKTERIENLAHRADKDNIILTPIKAIKAHCRDCCCGSINEVKLCPSTHCSLFPYRLGKRPKKNSFLNTLEQALQKAPN